MGCRLGAAAWVMSAALLFGQEPPADELAAGKQTYTTLCSQCHGTDGDSLGYADIVPVAGIGRRYPADVIGQLSGMFSGRILHGRDRERVVQYMVSLRGTKDFPDAGWLVTPYLLERKAPRIHQFRVLDTRSADAYRAGHAANAVSVEPRGCLSDPEETAEWLGQIGVTPETMVVVYDDRGGPDAACVWWRIRRAGHAYVAVLDGGWNQSVEENRYKTTVVPKIAPVNYGVRNTAPTHGERAAASRLSLSESGWNWRRVLNEDGFRRFDELLRLSTEAGLHSGAAFQIEGPEGELAHLVFTLDLLGYDAVYEAGPRVLTLRSRSARSSAVASAKP